MLFESLINIQNIYPSYETIYITNLQIFLSRGIHLSKIACNTDIHTSDFTNHSGLETTGLRYCSPHLLKTKYLYSDFTKFSSEIFAGDLFSYAIYYLLSPTTSVGLFTPLRKKGVQGTTFVQNSLCTRYLTGAHIQFSQMIKMRFKW